MRQNARYSGIHKFHTWWGICQDARMLWTREDVGGQEGSRILWCLFILRENFRCRSAAILKCFIYTQTWNNIYTIFTNRNVNKALYRRILPYPEFPFELFLWLSIARSTETSILFWRRSYFIDLSSSTIRNSRKISFGAILEKLIHIEIIYLFLESSVLLL